MPVIQNILNVQEILGSEDIFLTNVVQLPDGDDFRYFAFEFIMFSHIFAFEFKFITLGRYV